MAKKAHKEMSFMEHLEELRWVMVRCSLATVIMAFTTYMVNDFLFNSVIFGPTKAEFVTYRFFCDASKYLGIAENICITDLDFKIQNTSMEGQINTFIWICITAGFILAFPYIIYQFWNFISPALYEKERKSAKAFIIVSSLLFFLGVLFGYFVIIPMTINFVSTFQISTAVVNEFNLESYISMIKSSVLVSGLFFELPVIIYFLTKLGLITVAFLRKYRRYAIVIVLIIAAIVTPPDVVSQVTVSIPMLLVFEASVIIAAVVEKRRLKA